MHDMVVIIVEFGIKIALHILYVQMYIHTYYIHTYIHT